MKVNGSTHLAYIELRKTAPDNAVGELHVTFTDSTRGFYANVPQSVYSQLVDANDDPQASVGKLFHLLVKSHPTKYPWKKLS